MAIADLVEVIRGIDAGLVSKLAQRREAVLDDARLQVYVDQAPGGASAEETLYQQAYLLVVRLINAIEGIALWGDVPADTEDHLAFLGTRPSIPVLRTRILDYAEASYSTVDLETRVATFLNHESRAAWAPDRFTAPNEATPWSFRFFITALRTNMVELTAEATTRYLLGSRGAFVVRHDDGTGIFDPARYMIHVRGEAPSDVISCSVLSNERSKTYRNMCFGLVLRVPPSNVVRAEPRDIETSGVQRWARERQVSGLSHFARLNADLEYWSLLGGQVREALPTPDEILEETNPNGHNEILVLGRTEHGGPVAVSAIFVKTHGGKLWQDFFGREGRIAAAVLEEARTGLPIVAIEDNRRPASNVDFADWLAGDTQPLGSIGSGQSCSQCQRVHGWAPSLVRRWHECSVCRAIYCWSCGWCLRYYQATGLGEVLDMMDENFYNPGVRACAFCGGRTRHV